MQEKPKYPSINIENQKYDMSNWYNEKTYLLNKNIALLIDYINNKKVNDEIITKLLNEILLYSIKLFSISTGIEYNPKDKELLLKGSQGFYEFLAINNLDKLFNTFN